MPQDGQSEFDELILGITPDVMAVLERQSFFDRLEKRVFPTGVVASPVCKNDFSIATNLLTELGHDADAIADVVAVMRAHGGIATARSF